MIRWLIDFFSGCTHERLTWPIGKKGNAKQSCLECGKVFAYDWDTMKIVAKHRAPVIDIEQVRKAG